jgi:uncharacterized alpha-E superfamily protein
MLSRTASDLYWLSRYLERAENSARMLEVSHSMAMMPSGRSAEQELAAPLRVTGSVEEFWSQHSRLNFAELYKFLGWNADHHASIYHCFRRARENAHAVRGRITAEMWETINATWIELNRMRAQPPELKPFCDWVKERSHLWRGTAYGTLARGDAFHFLRLGTFLERADNSARLLGVKQFDAGDESNALRDYYQWTALLQALGALEAHQDAYGGKLDGSTVAEMLILRSDTPRSLRACLEEINSILSQISGPQGRRAKGIARTLLAELEFGSIKELQQDGMTVFLERFLKTTDSISSEISHAYFEAV